jgi:hypothetical protein
MTERDEFSVYLFFPDESSFCERQFIGAREAVELAAECSRRPAAIAGSIRRIIITDGGDDTVFEWLYGQGVTFPRQMEGRKARAERKAI